jgi:hypothetical protein
MEKPGHIRGLADRRAWLMARMMNRLGVTLADATQADLSVLTRVASHACMRCTHAAQCEAWLSHSNTAFAADAPDFCPNARIFRRLRAIQG